MDDVHLSKQGQRRLGLGCSHDDPKHPYVCGLIAWYNATEPPPGPDRTPYLLRQTLTRRLTIRGFIVLDFAPGDFLQDVGQWVRAGRLRYREDIRTGLEHAPEALIGPLEGENFGKLLIQVAPDPTA